MKGECRLQRRRQRNQHICTYRYSPATSVAFRHQERHQNIQRHGKKYGHTADREHDVGKYPNIQPQHKQHQAREFLVSFVSVSVLAIFGNGSSAWLDSEANDRYVSDRKLFRTYKPLPTSSVTTRSGVRTIFGQEQVQFQLNNGTTSLTCLNVPDFKVKII